MRKLIHILFILLMSCSSLHARDNTLVGIKIMPMPDNRVRMDFQFAHPLQQLPASFITQEPPRLVLDFIDSNLRLNEADKAKKIDFGSLARYKIIAVKNRVRAILELSDSISYSGQISGNTYSLMLRGKDQQLIPQRKEVFVTNRPVNARFSINSLDFTGADKQGGRLIVNVSNTGIPIDQVKKWPFNL